MKSYIYLCAFLLITSGCTVTVTQTATDTHGWAEDVVDETQRTDSEVDAEADLDVPATLV
jgi:uncharacterized protein YceK